MADETTTRNQGTQASQGQFSGSAAQQGTGGAGQNEQPGGATQRRGAQAALSRYTRNPFALMQDLSNEMDRVFESFLGGVPTRGRSQPQQGSTPSLWMPEIEISEKGNELEVCIDLPGMSKDNVSIDVQQGALIVQGERREEHNEGEGQQGFRRSERRYGSFYREIPLPDYIDADQGQARMDNGVLRITFPLTEQRQRRRLEIQG